MTISDWHVGLLNFPVKETLVVFQGAFHVMRSSGCVLLHISTPLSVLTLSAHTIKQFSFFFSWTDHFSIPLISLSIDAAAVWSPDPVQKGSRNSWCVVEARTDGCVWWQPHLDEMWCESALSHLLLCSNFLFTLKGNYLLAYMKLLQYSYWDPFLGLEFLCFSFRKSQPFCLSLSFWLFPVSPEISEVSQTRIFWPLKLCDRDINRSCPVHYHFNTEDGVDLAQWEWGTEWRDTSSCKAVLSSFQLFLFFHVLEKIFRVGSGSLQLIYSNMMSLFWSNPVQLFHWCIFSGIGLLHFEYWLFEKWRDGSILTAWLVLQEGFCNLFEINTVQLSKDICSMLKLSKQNTRKYTWWMTSRFQF